MCNWQNVKKNSVVTLPFGAISGTHLILQWWG
jgi:hypothetical protein